MKLSYSILLLAVFAGLQVHAAPKGSTCAAGSFGLANGDGYKGDCCKTNDDCRDACIRGVCNGPSAPSDQPTSSTCTPGSAGLGNGDGFRGDCCKTSHDCQDACLRGVCVGPVNPSPNKPTATTASPGKPTATTSPGKCLPGSFGLANGDGYNGDCCKTNDDCRDACIRGVCNGPAAPGNTGSCKKGYKGLGNGDGPLNACCASDDDCQSACIRNRCTAP